MVINLDPIEEEEEYWEFKRRKKFKVLDIEYYIEITEKSNAPYPEIKIEKHTPTQHYSKWIEQMTFFDPYEVKTLLEKVLELYELHEEDKYARGIEKDYRDGNKDDANP